MLREFWHTSILKRVGPPAVHKITHEAISEKSVSKIMDDLALHYGRSDVVISLLTDLHERAGPIPDPQLEPRSCHKVLALHSEILSGMSEFIQSSSDQDQHKNLYNPFVCKTLFKLIPQSVHFNNPIFRTSSGSAGMDYETKYEAWKKWVTNTMQTLKEMDAELGVSIPCKPLLVHIQSWWRQVLRITQALRSAKHSQ